MSAPRALMVTSQWPPVASIGTRRVVRIARHLPAAGWTPVLLVDSPSGSGLAHPNPTDDSLGTPDVEIYRAAGVMPGTRLRRGLLNAVARTGSPRAVQIANRLTVGLALPDHYPEWAPAAVRVAKQIPRVDAVWVSGRPFGLFVAGVAVARALDVPCVLDYRDPWSLDERPSWIPQWPPAAHRALEAQLLKRARGAAFVNEDMLARNQAAFGIPPGACWRAIPNGYEQAEYDGLTPHVPDRPTLLYTGGFYGQRTAEPVLRALAAAPDLDLCLRIFGELDTAGRKQLERAPMPDRVQVHGRVDVAEVRSWQLGATALLLAVGEAHRTALTGKVFDYICAGRPILGYGPPDATAGALIRDAGLGLWVDESDTEALTAALRLAAAGRLPFDPQPRVLAPYTAINMARRTAALLDAVVGRRAG